MTISLSPARRSLIALSAALSIPGLAAADPGTPPAIPRMVQIPVPRSTAHPEGMRTIPAEPDNYAATYLPNIEYARRGDRALRLQILRPREIPPMLRRPSTPANYPAIVYVQGSGWGPQDLYSAIPQLSELAHRGYVVASVEYTPSTVAPAPAQIQDVKAAIRFLRANAARFGVDPARIGIWGDSSGGHLAALVATSAGVQAFETADHEDQSDAVGAAVDFYGVHDLTTFSHFPSWFDEEAEGSPAALLLGQPPARAPALARLNSPITYVSRDRAIPPILLVHGDADVIVPFNQSVEFYERLRAAGKDVTFFRIAGGNHGFDFWSPAVIRLVVDFFDRHLAGRPGVPR